MKKNELKNIIKEELTIILENIIPTFVIQDHPIHWNKNDKTFSCEASDLDFSPRYFNGGVKVPSINKVIILKNKITKAEVKFQYSETEMTGPNHEQEVGAWIYKSSTGLKLIIFND